MGVGGLTAREALLVHGIAPRLPEEAPNSDRTAWDRGAREELHCRLAELPSSPSAAAASQLAAWCEADLAIAPSGQRQMLLTSSSSLLQQWLLAGRQWLRRLAALPE